MYAGGGVAFYLASNYPEVISAAVLIHSIPLDGLKFTDESGEPVQSEAMAGFVASLWPDDMSTEAYLEKLETLSSNPDGLPPASHGISAHLAGGVKMPGKKEGVVANL